MLKPKKKGLRKGKEPRAPLLVVAGAGETSEDTTTATTAEGPVPEGAVQAGTALCLLQHLGAFASFPPQFFVPLGIVVLQGTAFLPTIGQKGNGQRGSASMMSARLLLLCLVLFAPSPRNKKKQVNSCRLSPPSFFLKI